MVRSLPVLPTSITRVTQSHGLLIAIEAGWRAELSVSLAAGFGAQHANLAGN